MKFGLLGMTLGHSYSPRIHHALGNTGYELFECAPSQLSTFFKDPALQGLNITIPYKVKALQACHTVSAIANRIGCVNTMVRQENGQWYGHNTDYDGFIYMLRRAHIPIKGKHCLVLGDGATSKTAHVALTDLGALSITHVSRHTPPTYDAIEQFYETTQVIINTTPVGMYPHNPDSLIDVSAFHHLIGVSDVIYNPHRTSLIIEADALGIPSTDGLPMLVAQAVYAAKLFQGQGYDDHTIESILQPLRQELENIVLVGMPGVGKTTVGRQLAKVLHRPFYDSDDVFLRKMGQSSSSYINIHGEAAFREKESAILRELGTKTGVVITTGGGCVTVPENYMYLRQNGRIYQITRPLEELDMTDRPLSKGGLPALRQLAAIRTPMYESFAQRTISNRVVSETVALIKEDFYESISH